MNEGGQPRWREPNQPHVSAALTYTWWVTEALATPLHPGPALLTRWLGPRPSICITFMTNCRNPHPKLPRRALPQEGAAQGAAQER